MTEGPCIIKGNNLRNFIESCLGINMKPSFRCRSGTIKEVKLFD